MGMASGCRIDLQAWFAAATTRGGRAGFEPPADGRDTRDGHAPLTLA